jgi:hypothetical protein
MARQRPTLSERHSHPSPEPNPGRETQSRHVRGQPWGDAVTACPRPTTGERRNHGSLEACVSRPRPTLSGRHSHASPEGNLGWET